jgi:D-xylonolactonase
MNLQIGEAEIVVNEHCVVGEGPVWDERRGRLYWTDIDGGKVFCWDAATRTHRQIYKGEPVGGFTLQDNGDLLLFRANNFATLGEDGVVRVLRDSIDPKMVRFNDVVADPEGRVFAGTIGENLDGGLYRIDLDGAVTLLERGTDCSNGLDFSPDLKTMYWCDTSAMRIFRYAYDRASGEISGKRELVHVTDGQGVPDGLTIDTEANLWSARWGGWGVFRYSHDGKLIGKVEVPVAKASSVIFGGKELDTLFITTAAYPDAPDQQPQPLDGALFAVRVAAQGRPSFRSRVMVGG